MTLILLRIKFGLQQHSSNIYVAYLNYDFSFFKIYLRIHAENTTKKIVIIKHQEKQQTFPHRLYRLNWENQSISLKTSCNSISNL